MCICVHTAQHSIHLEVWAEAQVQVQGWAGFALN